MATTLSLQTFTSLVQNSAAAAQGACSRLLKLAPGSVVLTILQSSASVALWLQWLLVQLMARQRLATCTGTDADTFVADYGCSRLAAVAATGVVTFSRFTSTASATVPVGATVQTGDGTQVFAVVSDATNGYWSAGSGGYLIPAGVGSAALPVAALTPGSAGNVVPGAISLMGQAVPGVDTVTNAVATTGGQDAESDAALIARFPLFIASLAQATPQAIAAAISEVQQGISYAIAANSLPNGTYQPGTFTVTIDDGSGYPGATLQSRVYAAVDAVRPVGSTFSVQPPTVTSAAVVLTLNVAAGIVKANVIGTVAAAITAYINGLPIGANLSYLMLAAVTTSSLPSGQITGITGLTLNAGTSDLVVGASGVVKTGSVVIN